MSSLRTFFGERNKLSGTLVRCYVAYEQAPSKHVLRLLIEKLVAGWRGGRSYAAFVTFGPGFLIIAGYQVIRHWIAGVQLASE